MKLEKAEEKSDVEKDSEKPAAATVSEEKEKKGYEVISTHFTWVVGWEGMGQEGNHLFCESSLIQYVK